MGETTYGYEKLKDEELVEKWKTACKWTEKRMQEPYTNKNQLGQPYDHEEFLIALDKIEKLELEMQKRSIQYVR